MKSVLITGTSSGIGHALCKEYLNRGWTVFASARNTENLSELNHPSLIPLELDVTDSDDIAEAASRIEEYSGHLDLLINNAGYAAMGPLADMPENDLHAQFTTNVYAPVMLTNACLELLRKAPEPRVIHIGSVSGITPTPFSGAYCASKAALHALADAQRMELAPFGIRVITVQPGAIESRFGDNSLNLLTSRISDDSWYNPVKEAIRARATASQDNPTPAAEFAAILCRKLDQSNPASIIRIGNGSRTLPLLKKLLPENTLDKILGKKFRLNELRK